MLLVGDIGSTKSSWYYSDGTVHHISLQGYNPLIHSRETGIAMVEALRTQLEGAAPEVIWYYGAGVVELQAADLVRQLMTSAFPSSQLQISTDLEGAARAACGKDPGTVAILGTGSHAAVFDGFHILRQASALGYILGDEGSGCDIGKSLTQAYFYDLMPEAVRIEMKKVISGSRAEFLKNLYQSATPNKFLAELAKVAVGLHDHPWIKELVSERFAVFVKRHVVPLSPIGPVHILGSIGCIFDSLIEKELHYQGLKAGLFIKDPSFRLFEIHQDHSFNEK